MLASFSGSAHELIAARALMGVGAAGDVVGAALSIVALTSVVWGLIEASSREWTDPSILGGFALGGVVLAAFLAWERRVAQPMIDIEVFRNLRFSAASLSVMLAFFDLVVGSRLAVTVAAAWGSKIAVAGGLVTVAGGLEILSLADLN